MLGNKQYTPSNIGNKLYNGLTIGNKVYQGVKALNNIVQQHQANPEIHNTSNHPDMQYEPLKNNQFKAVRPHRPQSLEKPRREKHGSDKYA